MERERRRRRPSAWRVHLLSADVWPARRAACREVAEEPLPSPLRCALGGFKVLSHGGRASMGAGHGAGGPLRFTRRSHTLGGRGGAGWLVSTSSHLSHGLPPHARRACRRRPGDILRFTRRRPHPQRGALARDDGSGADRIFAFFGGVWDAPPGLTLLKAVDISLTSYPQEGKSATSDSRVFGASRISR